MKYLLSDGQVTTSKDEAVIDSLMIQLQMETRACPLYSGGMDQVIHEIIESKIQGELYNRVESVISRVNSQFGVSLVASDLVLNSDDSYSLNITYNGNERKIYSRYQIGT